MLQHLIVHQVMMAFVRRIGSSSPVCNIGGSFKRAQQALMKCHTGEQCLVVAAAGVTASEGPGRRRSSSKHVNQANDEEPVGMMQQQQPTHRRRRRKRASQDQAPEQQEMLSAQAQQQHESVDLLLSCATQQGFVQESQLVSARTNPAVIPSRLHHPTIQTATGSSTRHDTDPALSTSSSSQQAASNERSAAPYVHAAATVEAGNQQHASSYISDSTEPYSDEGDNSINVASYDDDDDDDDDNVDYLYRNGDEVQSAISRITRFLDFRERCASEVLTKLHSLGVGRDLSQQVLLTLQQADIQSDKRFAECYVRGSWRSKAQSPTRLAYELRSRGVAREHIDAALSSVFGAGKQLPAREPGNPAEEEAWDHLVEVCKRKVEFTQGDPAQKRRAKLAGWLQRRGHSMSTVFRVFDAVGI